MTWYSKVTRRAYEVSWVGIIISGEREAMPGNALAAAMHVILHADDEFIDETFDQHGYRLPPNSHAIEWGLAISLLLTVAIDLGLFDCVKCVGLIERKKNNQ